MKTNLITTDISTTELTFKPGESAVSFEINAINYSDRFASFQVEVLAAGTDENLAPNWYILSPEICTKKPPGDSTQFLVKIIDSPLPGFVGQMNLTVRVFSIELQEETRQLLRLNILEGSGGVGLKLTLPVQEFQAYPLQQIKIPVQVYNPSSQPANAVLKLTGINPTWLIEEQQLIQIPSRFRVDAVFWCQIPDIIQTKSQVQPFTITATITNGLSRQITGNLLILPQGIVEFRCFPQERRIPNRRRFFWRSDPVIFHIEIKNYSNISQIFQLQINCSDKIKYELKSDLSLLIQDKKKSIEPVNHDVEINDFDPTIDLEIGETNQILLFTKVKRHWLGRMREFLIEVTTIQTQNLSSVSDSRLSGTSPPSQILKLKVLPFIPRWLILTGSVVLLGLLWWFSALNPYHPSLGHKKPVNSVQFDGLASTIMSGSNDQTIAEWKVTNFFNDLHNQFIGKIGNTKKAVRVLRYRPVDNNMIAAGLENGEIQLWGLTEETGLIDTFSINKDDRVFALEFSQDSQTLFSGHGSGLVLQWDASLQRDQIAKGSDRLSKKKQFDFAVYDLSFVGKDNRHLAVVGRYNQFLIWNLDQNKTLKVPYPTGGQDDYILSVDVAEIAPNILATGDNQGNITIWNMKNCLDSSGECEVIDRWQGSKMGEAVRSVSFSDNGCYLASGGDDGKVMLWALTSEGKRPLTMPDGSSIENNLGIKQEVSHSYLQKKINSVDVKIVDKNILIASGGDDNQVRIAQTKRIFNLGCDFRNNLEIE
jgi:WD40 repeat protein